MNGETARTAGGPLEKLQRTARFVSKTALELVQVTRLTCGFDWAGRPPALPVEAARKKAFAASIERSGLLTVSCR